MLFELHARRPRCSITLCHFTPPLDETRTMTLVHILPLFLLSRQRLLPSTLFVGVPFLYYDSSTESNPAQLQYSPSTSSIRPLPRHSPPPSSIRPLPRHSPSPIHPAPATVIPVAPVTSFPRKRESSSTRQTRTHRNSHTTQQRPLRPAYTNSKTGYEADRASFSLKIFIGSHHLGSHHS